MAYAAPTGMYRQQLPEQNAGKGQSVSEEFWSMLEHGIYGPGGQPEIPYVLFPVVLERRRA
jgi:hypothetical protein